MGREAGTGQGLAGPESPRGHWVYPVFRPCEVVRAHLVAAGKDYLELVHYNGATCLRSCAKTSLPRAKGTTTRCTKKGP